MSTISVDYDVLNQKGSPAWFSDTFANIPTFGYKGRMFISIDTFAFYRDTGTGWDLIGGPGIGTLTGSGTTGQVSFFNGTQVLTGNNNLFWDNTNSRLGINTATPGQALDVHSTANTLVQLNNTTTADSVIAFQNQNVTKWKIGNVYNAGANSFSITNPILSSTPFSISSGDAITLNSNVTTTGAQLVQNGLYLSNASAGALAFYTNISGRDDGINFALRNLTGGAGFIFQSAASYNYTFPATTGTLALTSNLSAYLPLAGGTLTGALIGTTALFSGNLEAGRIGGAVTIGDLFVDSANNSVYVGRQSSTSGDNSKFYVRNRLNTLTALSVDPGGNGSVDVVGTFSTTRGANLATSTGEVGIGISSPSAKLHVRIDSATLPNDIAIVQGGGSVGNFGFSCMSQNGDKIFYTNHLTYGVFLPQLSNGSLTVVSGQIVSVSDINLKNDDGIIENALDKICKLTPRYFYWKDESGIDTKERQLGFYAQEVKATLGEEVANNNGNGKWGIYDRGIIAMLTKAIQELNEKLVRNNIN